MIALAGGERGTRDHVKAVRAELEDLSASVELALVHLEVRRDQLKAAGDPGDLEGIEDAIRAGEAAVKVIDELVAILDQAVAWLEALERHAVN